MQTIPISQLYRVSFCDPAGSKAKATDASIKRTRSLAAIVTIGQDRDLDRIFLLDVWAKRCSTDVLTDAIFSMNDRWTPQRFGCEANGMQLLYESSLFREARMRNVRLPIEAINQSTRVEKTWRIRTELQPVQAEGRLFWHQSQTEFFSQFGSFPRGHLDIMDALASAVHMLPKVTPTYVEDQEIEATAAYLRETGAPPEYITQRVMELRAERTATTNAHLYSQ
jgi:hypothetical protein